MEKRKNPRYRTLANVAFIAEGVEGEGVLNELSSGGAAIEPATLRPAIGSELRLEVFAGPSCRLLIVGTVCRHTETGFAVELAEELDELVEHVAAVAMGEKEPGIEV